MRIVQAFSIFILLSLAFSCTEKANLSVDLDVREGQTAFTDNDPDDAEEDFQPSFRVKQEVNPMSLEGPEQNIGVFYMPSWDAMSGGKPVDVFWACLKGKENCPFLNNSAIWGPNGRIYNAKYPYEGPYLNKKPHASLRGFYRRDDPEVIRKQIEYMKAYGIDFFAYNWYYGRHYYYHLDFAPQSKIYYPQGWAADKSKDGRVDVPGVEEWTEQLAALLQVNEQLPKDKQIKFALNWVDDGNERWLSWLNLGSPDNIRNKVNYPGEAPTRELFLKVHDKMTRLWIDKYFKRDDYLKDSQGRPVLYFYFPHDTESRAAFYKVSLQELIDRSQILAKDAGFKGIKFIAVASGSMQPNELPFGMPTAWKAKDPQKPWLGGSYEEKLLFQDYVPRLKKMGFEGLTAYVYHSFYGQSNRNYRDMRNTYKGHWRTWSEYFKDDPGFEYQVPVAMGWNMKPMGGTWPQQSGFPSEPEKDEVISNKSTFKQKLLDARKVSKQYQYTNGNTIMICCWNEFLEGNHIEPSEGHGFDYLEAIEEVFSDQ